MTDPKDPAVAPGEEMESIEDLVVGDPGVIGMDGAVELPGDELPDEETV